MTTLHSIPNDLNIAKELVYDPCGFTLTDLNLHSESVEYSACLFVLDEKVIQYRNSKITPTKTGQFVTIWKRNKDGITAPFDFTDDFDFIIIAARSGDHFGQFIFPKSVLADKGIITRNGKEGKRGIRVYPPWDSTTSKQAEKTQSWQTKYFLSIKKHDSTDLGLMKELFTQPKMTVQES
ncbi:MepB family protein [Flavobacterium sp.]|uniref:MepB family protein n=1 Tax=Flavobacterium sp. TaxID=239 RepID=UPI002632CD18|nr:MepB family protein [Flavobacterium sp.]